MIKIMGGVNTDKHPLKRIEMPLQSFQLPSPYKLPTNNKTNDCEPFMKAKTIYHITYIPQVTKCKPKTRFCLHTNKNPQGKIFQW